MSSNSAHQHQHTHHNHGHHDHHDHNFAHANEDHFDQTAHEYSEREDFLELSRKIAAGIRGMHGFDPASTALMEFACGVGFVSTEMAPYCKTVVGVDISQGMIDQFEKRVQKLGLDSDKVRAVRAELKKDEPAPKELEGVKFDAIICTMAYHHFESVVDITKILISYLNPGGVLLVADFLASEQEEAAVAKDFKGVEHIVPHRHGFDSNDMRQTFEAAGLKEFKFDVVASAIRIRDESNSYGVRFDLTGESKEGTKVHAFVAKGTK